MAAVKGVLHIVKVTTAGVNFDQGATIPVQVYKLRVLSTFGPAFRVDALVNIDATDVTPGNDFLTKQGPEKLPGLGERPKASDVVEVNLQAAERIALLAIAAETTQQANGEQELYIEITALTPFTVPAAMAM